MTATHDKQIDSLRGWGIVAAAFIGLGLSYAMFTVFMFGTLVTPLQAEFGWNRAQMSVALTITNLVVVVGSPLLGHGVDRVGVRALLTPSVLSMGLAVWAMSHLNNNIYGFYAGYLAITALGLGTLPLTYSRLVVHWFVRRRGLALGIALAGFGAGGAMVPEVSRYMIEHHGWRSAYQLFAACVLFISLPLSIWVLREPRAPASATTVEATGMSNIQAAGTRDYWLLLASFFLVGIGVTSVLSHLVPMLLDRGMPLTEAARCMSTLALALIVGRISAGFLMDYLFAPWVAAGFIIFGLAGGVALLATGATGAYAYLAAALVGLATGSEISEIAYIVGRYFGQLAFGQIYGFMFAAFQLGSALAPPAMGYYFDRVGNYSGALWAVVVCVLVGAALVAAMSRAGYEARTTRP
jgi:MFS family permease